jgi:hypothetical protein
MHIMLSSIVFYQLLLIYRLCFNIVKNLCLQENYILANKKPRINCEAAEILIFLTY